MSEKYPSVKDIEISNVRKRQVEEDIQKGFEKNLLCRELVKIEKTKPENLDKEFFKIGLASISDKIWFVDEPGGKTYYDYKGLGYDYGESVAEGETKGIIDRIIKAVKKEKIIQSKEEKIKEAELIDVITMLLRENYKDIAILTNIYNISDFYRLDKDFFIQQKISDKQIGSIEFSNMIIPVLMSRLVPKGITLLIDRSEIGKLLIKQLLKIEITDNFSLEKKEKIIKDIPSLTKEELDEKVEIQVYEIIRFEVENPDAVVMIKHEN